MTDPRALPATADATSDGAGLAAPASAGVGERLRSAAGWLRRAAVGAAADGGRLVAGAIREGVDVWRRSLQLRVVVSTLVLSLVVAIGLGLIVVRQIADGLLQTKAVAATADATAGLDSAQAGLDAARDVQPGALSQLLTQLVQELARGGGRSGTYEVVLLGPPGRAANASGAVDVASVPPRLRDRVESQSRVASTYTLLTYQGGGKPAVPAYVVGGPVEVPGDGIYQMYFLFPLDQQQATLDLVRRAVVTAAILLALLLAGVAWLVVRQVVTPVRMAARIADRLAAGRLQERMPVHGTDDLARLARAFNEMASGLQRQIRQLEHLSRVQQRFVSDVSHELRTPLTTVRMAADVLHESSAGFEPAVRRSAELLQTQLDRFESLLGDLLEISRFDAGAAKLELEHVDLRNLVRRVCDAFTPLAEQKSSRLVLRLSSRPCTADIDTRRVDRIVRNLVGNALEHGGGDDVEVRVDADADAVAVAVRDHGAGLRPGEAALVFNRFWRADPARARATGGSGLGLSIALEDARLHSGWLQAWGEPGVGAQFRLTLPRRAGVQLRSSPVSLMPADVQLEALESVGGPFLQIARREVRRAPR